MLTPSLKSRHLLFTERGSEWLAQFENGNQETAERLVDSLTLVSHSEFERGLTELIQRQAAQVSDPLALFATREVDPRQSYFGQAGSSVGISAVAPGSDLGSEARVAAKMLARPLPLVQRFIVDNRFYRH
jgi:hypothetical protein